MVARIITILILLLMLPSLCYAGPGARRLLMVAKPLPPNELFTSGANGWSGTWGWESSSHMGGGMYATSGTSALTKVITALGPCNMTVYSRVSAGSLSSFTACNGAACVNLNTSSTWTKSGDLALSAGDNTITITASGGTYGALIDTIEFR